MQIAEELQPAPRIRRLRVGIDTGGTFTDIVAIDEATGEIFTTKTPSTQHDPSVGVLDGIRKIVRLAGQAASAAAMAEPRPAVVGVCHGTTVATNALLEERFPGTGLVTTQGFRHVLEIARQACHAGTATPTSGSSPIASFPLHRVREVAERLEFSRRGAAPVRRSRRPGRWRAGSGSRASSRIGVCFIHAYANAEHEQRMRDVLEREHPEAHGRHLVRGPARVPRVRARGDDARRRVRQAARGRATSAPSRRVLDTELGAGVPFYVMKSNGGVISAREVAARPITTILSGPAAGALGASAARQGRGLRPRAHRWMAGARAPTSALVEHGVPGADHGRRGGPLPGQGADDRHRHRGLWRWQSIAWLHADGRLKVGPRSAGADPGPLCYGRGGVEPTVTDAELVLGRIPPRLLGGEIRLDVERAREGIAALGGAAGPRTRAAPRRACSRSRPGTRPTPCSQVTVKRGLDVRDYMLVAFGGSGPLLAGRLVDMLHLRGALIPPSPGNVSAFGLLTVDLKNDYVETVVQRHDRLDYSA